MEKVQFKEDENKFFDMCVKNKLVPKNDAMKQIIFKRIIQDFDDGKKYTEDEVNEKIKKYFDDFAFIRRELINFGYMQRNPYTSMYWVVKRELFKPDFLKISRLKQHALEIGILKDEPSPKSLAKS